MDKLITIVMPVYNAERFLKETVESVLRQTYQNWELLMIDDCSKDSSLQLALTYAEKDARIHVIESKENAGAAKSRNKGIAQAKGEYIAMLDSDDVWSPDKLKSQLVLMEQTGAKIGYTSYDFMDEHSISVQRPFIVPVTTDYRKMLACNVIGCSTSVVDAALLKEHPFKPEFYHEDYVLWMELLSIPGVKAVGSTEILTHYRRVVGSRSDNKKNAAKERWKVYREALGMGVLSSLRAFVRYAANGVIKYYL